MRGIHRWPVSSPHKGPVTRKVFRFDDVIMNISYCCHHLRGYCVDGDGLCRWTTRHYLTNVVQIISWHILSPVLSELTSTLQRIWTILKNNPGYRRCTSSNFRQVVFLMARWLQASIGPGDGLLQFINKPWPYCVKTMIYDTIKHQHVTV